MEAYLHTGFKTKALGYRISHSLPKVVRVLYYSVLMIRKTLPLSAACMKNLRARAMEGVLSTKDGLQEHKSSRGHYELNSIEGCQRPTLPARANLQTYNSYGSIMPRRDYAKVQNTRVSHKSRLLQLIDEFAI